MTAMDFVAERVPILLRPSLLLMLGIYHFTITTLTVLFTTPSKLFDVQQLRHKSFSRLWNKNGAQMSQEMPAGIDELLASVSGFVLDLGPGTGEILSRMSSGKITKMYGAEPALDMHPALLKNVEKHGFGGGKYEAMLCGAEPESLIPALAKAGVLKCNNGEGVFDEICCIRVLCGIPKPKETLKTLYGLLKPGGRMVVCEHVVNPWRTEGYWLARLMQFVYTVAGWPFFMAGCEMQRHTPEFLKEAAGKQGWASVKLNYVEPRTAVPFVVGELRKRK